MSAQDELKPEVTHLEICPDGDMEVVLQSCLGNVTYQYQVSSLQLCAYSSVFRAMLGPKSSFAEAVELRRHHLLEADSSDVSRIYKLNVEDHDPTALAAVLGVIHARTGDLPDEIPFEGLLQIAIICDYYDCAAAMRPWDDMWMKQWKEHAESPGFESWLFISRVFKEQAIFQDLSKRIIRNSIVVDGELKVVVGDESTTIEANLESHTPQGIVGSSFLKSVERTGLTVVQTLYCNNATTYARSFSRYGVKSMTDTRTIPKPTAPMGTHLSSAIISCLASFTRSLRLLVYSLRSTTT